MEIRATELLIDSIKAPLNNGQEQNINIDTELEEQQLSFLEELFLQQPSTILPSMPSPALNPKPTLNSSEIPETSQDTILPPELMPTLISEQLTTMPLVQKAEPKVSISLNSERLDPEMTDATPLEIETAPEYTEVSLEPYQTSPTPHLVETSPRIQTKAPEEQKPELTLKDFTPPLEIKKATPIQSEAKTVVKTESDAGKNEEPLLQFSDFATTPVTKPQPQQHQQQHQHNMNDPQPEISVRPLQAITSESTPLTSFENLAPNKATQNTQQLPPIQFAFSHNTHANGDQHLKINLLPPELGHIRVDLKVDGVTGEKSVVMSFSIAQTHDLFKDNSQSLQQMLLRAGYDIQPDQITLQHPGEELRDNLQNFFAQQQQQHEQTPKRKWGNPVEEDEVEAPLYTNINRLMNISA